MDSDCAQEIISPSLIRMLQSLGVGVDWCSVAYYQEVVLEPDPKEGLAPAITYSYCTPGYIPTP